MTPREPLVRTEALTKLYGEAIVIRALDQVNLSIYQGEIVAVMGPSGSGKSTLLHMLGALDLPTSGKVFIGGQDVAQIRDIDRFRSETVGFVFQMHNLIPTLTALENVEVPLRGRRMPSAARRKRALEMLELVGLADRLDHLPSQLSGGQRQRVAVARALANAPSLVLADEPTGNLDSVSGEEIIQLLTTLNREHGATILIVTHDRHVARAAQRILTMHDGQIVDEHRVLGPLFEDLHALAQSDLGRSLARRDIEALARLPFVEDGQLTPGAQELSRVLAEFAERAGAGA
ncbi:MAG: ABC transporter ATP-binding protein [Chloroflexi bacterium]|nr:ABC transporter ATP-binding protein [Chloroflexota bacterium]